MQENGEEKVSAYGSKSLSKTHKLLYNYELLACVDFVKQFHHYQWGRRFLLRTDHASLKSLVNFREPEGMLARWSSVLSNYDFMSNIGMGLCTVIRMGCRGFLHIGVNV